MTAVKSLTQKATYDETLATMLSQLSVKQEKKGNMDEETSLFFKAIAPQMPKAKSLLGRISKMSDAEVCKLFFVWLSENPYQLKFVKQRPPLDFKQHPAACVALLSDLTFLDFQRIWKEGSSSRSLSFMKAMTVHPHFIKLESKERAKAVLEMILQEDLEDLEKIFLRLNLQEKEVLQLVDIALNEKKEFFIHFVKEQHVVSITSSLSSHYKKALGEMDFEKLCFLLPLMGVHRLDERQINQLFSVAATSQDDAFTLFLLQTIPKGINQEIIRFLLGTLGARELHLHSETSLLVIEILRAKLPDSRVASKNFVLSALDKKPASLDDELMYQKLCELVKSSFLQDIDRSCLTLLLTSAIHNQHGVLLDFLAEKPFDLARSFALLGQCDEEFSIKDVQFKKEIERVAICYLRDQPRDVLPFLLRIGCDLAEPLMATQSTNPQKETVWVSALKEDRQLMNSFLRRLEGRAFESKADFWLLDLMLEAFDFLDKPQAFVQLCERALIKKEKKLLDYCIQSRSFKRATDETVVELARKYPKFKEALDKTSRSLSFLSRKSGK